MDRYSISLAIPRSPRQMMIRVRLSVLFFFMHCRITASAACPLILWMSEPALFFLMLRQIYSTTSSESIFS